MTSEDGWQKRGFVAHAFGSPEDGTTYTNSREAFDLSYRNGFRTFESDMVLLKDGEVLIAHDGFEERYGLDDGQRFGDVTSKEMKGRKLDGRFPVLLGLDFARIVAEHPDAYFILDTKGLHIEIARWIVRHLPHESLDRLRPHVHTQKQIDALRTLYPWKGFVLAAYTWSDDSKLPERAEELVRRNGITTFMVPKEKYTQELHERVSRAGARYVFVHSLTEDEEIRSWRVRGVGVYSNGWIG